MQASPSSQGPVAHMLLLISGPSPLSPHWLAPGSGCTRLPPQLSCWQLQILSQGGLRKGFWLERDQEACPRCCLDLLSLE